MINFLNLRNKIEKRADDILKLHNEAVGYISKIEMGVGSFFIGYNNKSIKIQLTFKHLNLNNSQWKKYLKEESIKINESRR